MGLYLSGSRPFTIAYIMQVSLIGLHNGESLPANQELYCVKIDSCFPFFMMLPQSHMCLNNFAHDDWAMFVNKTLHTCYVWGLRVTRFQYIGIAINTNIRHAETSVFFHLADDVLPTNLVTSPIREIRRNNDRITLKFDRRLGSIAAEGPENYQHVWKNLNLNISRLRDFTRSCSKTLVR